MKLGEALILRADIQKRIESIKDRIYNNVLIQEGEEVSEDPNQLIAEYFKLEEELRKLIRSINKTNMLSEFEGDMTLADALVLRDSLLSQRRGLVNILERASLRQERYSMKEIRYLTTIDIKERQKEADELAKRYRELDIKIQAKNWLTDLIE